MPCTKFLLLTALTTLLIALLTGTTFGAILSKSTTTPSNLPTTNSARACNGQQAYCNTSYSTLTQIGSHDSPFVGPLPQQNQNIPIPDQLDLGVRFLQAQTHENILDDSIIQLCHTSCFLEDAGTLESFLETIKSWLDDHPNEVVTLLLTNQASFPASKFGDVFESAGLREYAFVPGSSPDMLPMDQWPSLGELIDEGTRLIVFLDYGANTEKVPYILDEFAYYFETPYDITDPSFNGCSIDRPPNASPAGRMYIVNHFLDIEIFGILIPDRDRADQTNAATGEGSITDQTKLCRGLYGRPPNVVLLDFVDQGEAMKAQTMLNGI